MAGFALAAGDLFFLIDNQVATVNPDLWIVALGFW